MSFGGLSINVSADSLVNCRSKYWPLCQPILGWLSTKMLVESRSSIDRYLGQVVFSCWLCIGRQMASVVCLQCIIQLSVVYWLTIGIALNQLIYQPSDVLLFVEYQQTNLLTVSRDSIGSVSPVYRWTAGRLSVRYQLLVYLLTIAIAFTLCFALCYKVPDVSWHAMDTNACYAYWFWLITGWTQAIRQQSTGLVLADYQPIDCGGRVLATYWSRCGRLLTDSRPLLDCHLTNASTYILTKVSTVTLAKCQWYVDDP